LLEPLQAGKDEAARLFIVFNDLTSGKETYGAARFVYAKLPQAGTTVIDFNRAYNPPCAYNSFTTCPLPLPSNRLNVRILAGERRYQTRSSKQAGRLGHRAEYVNRRNREAW